jgi:Uma2 family endonuclease
MGYNRSDMSTLAQEKAQPRRFPITVEVYHFMAERGAFAPDERVELLDGEIREMSPIGSLHARCVNLLTEFLHRTFAGRYIVSAQNPIILDDLSEPQPDIALLERREDFYKSELPSARDVALVFEVADSSVTFDRYRKLPKYAEAGIPEAWLVDLESEHIEVHFQPKEDTYGTVKIYRRGEAAVSETIPEFNISVDDLLG